MNMRFMVAGALVLASLGGCAADTQTTSAGTTSAGYTSKCIPDGYATDCPNPTGTNPMAALWTTITGKPSAAHASASTTRPPS